MTVLSTPPRTMKYSGVRQHRCSSALDLCTCSAWASGDSFEIGDGRILIYSSIGVQNSHFEFKMLIFQHSSAKKHCRMGISTSFISYSPNCGGEHCIGCSCQLFRMSTKSVLFSERFCQKANWLSKGRLLILNIV